MGLLESIGYIIGMIMFAWVVIICIAVVIADLLCKIHIWSIKHGIGRTTTGVEDFHRHVAFPPTPIQPQFQNEIIPVVATRKTVAEPPGEVRPRYDLVRN